MRRRAMRMVNSSMNGQMVDPVKITLILVVITADKDNFTWNRLSIIAATLVDTRLTDYFCTTNQAGSVPQLAIWLDQFHTVALGLWVGVVMPIRINTSRK